MPFSVWARGDSNTANNASLNAVPTNQQATTLLTFEATAGGDEKLEFNKGAGTIDPDTVVYVGSNPTPYTFVMQFGGYLPNSNKLSNVNGVDLRGAEIQVLTVQGTGQRFFFLVGSDGSTFYFNVMRAFPNGAHTITGVYACYAAGTLIDTPRGQQRVEDLGEGDLVLTEDGRAVSVRLTVSRTLTQGDISVFDALRPVVIPADLLASGVPSADLTVSALHRILIRDPDLDRLFGFEAAFVPARDLPGVRPGPGGSITYVHILCDAHECLIANGAESESLLAGDVALAAVGAEARERIRKIIGAGPVQTAFPCLTAREAALWRDVKRSQRRSRAA